MNKTTRTLIVSGIAASLFLAACGGSDDIVDSSCQALLSDGSGVVVGSGQPGDPSLPEPASGYRTALKKVTARNFMVTTSNAYASAPAARFCNRAAARPTRRSPCRPCSG